MFNLKKFAVLSASTLIAACGSSGSDSNTTDSGSIIPPSATTTSFTLSISDAPVDHAMAVVACFSEIQLIAAAESDNQLFRIGETAGVADANDMCADAEGSVVANTRGIDLLTVTGMSSVELLGNIDIPAGEYSQLRLSMSDESYALVDLDEDGIADDEDGDGQADKLPVRVPSQELKLDGFVASAGEPLAVTIEFDLRKGMTDPVGQPGYLLKPRGVRLVVDSESGHIEGSVAEGLLINNQCSVAPEDIENEVAFVYLYQGVGLLPDNLSDIGGSEENEALTTAPVLFDGAANYTFEIGFVDAGQYTLAVTCDDDVDPEDDDTVSFFAIQEAEVTTEQQTTTVNFTE